MVYEAEYKVVYLKKVVKREEIIVKSAGEDENEALVNTLNALSRKGIDPTSENCEITKVTGRWR